MNIDTAHSGKIIIKLTDSEVMLFFGGYSKISTSNANFKAIINKIIMKAIRTNPDFIKSKDLIIEVHSKELQGCEIHITRPCENNISVKNNSNGFIFCFANSDDMIKAVCRLYINFKTRNLYSSVYKYESIYILILKTIRLNNVDRIISEYSCANISYSQTAEACIDEYGIPLVKDNAIKRIGKPFFKAF